MQLESRERKWDGNGNGNGTGNGKLKITIPLAHAMDGRAVDSDSSSVDEISTTRQPRLANSVGDKNVSTDRSA